MSIKIGIIGATGYAGVELLRILLGHPGVEIAAVSSVSFEGKKLSDIYPALYEICDDLLADEDEIIEKSDVVFASVPHGVSEAIAVKCASKGAVFIDLGADFRLYNEDDYTQWYGGQYKEGDLHKGAVYGLPELYRDAVRGSKIIGNPGCYPTSIALALAPALKAKAIDPTTLIIDAKSGVTGAGRNLSQTTHFPDCNEAFAPYKVASHRHTPEIEQTLSELWGGAVTITFVPHLLPVNRGILSTIYVNIANGIIFNEIYDMYYNFYKGEKFVRVLPKGGIATLKNVKYSNYCDLSLHSDERTGRLIVVSAIDNMVKGAAGQAIQNMNLTCSLPEDMGLGMIPPSF